MQELAHVILIELTVAFPWFIRHREDISQVWFSSPIVEFLCQVLPFFYIPFLTSSYQFWPKLSFFKLIPQGKTKVKSDGRKKWNLIGLVQEHTGFVKLWSVRGSMAEWKDQGLGNQRDLDWNCHSAPTVCEGQMMRCRYKAQPAAQFIEDT